MKTSTQKILIIERNPLLIGLYQKLIAKHAITSYQLKIVASIADANQLFKLGKLYNMVIVSSEYNLQVTNISEERFLCNLKKHNKACKLFLIGNNSNQFKIHRIIDLFSPHVYLLQEELSQELLDKGFLALWKTRILYSPKIKLLNIKPREEFNTVDITDVDLLFYLVKNIKTKDLPEKVNLSLGAIEKRKNKLKQKLDTKNLLQAAYEKGLL